MCKIPAHIMRCYFDTESDLIDMHTLFDQILIYSMEDTSRPELNIASILRTRMEKHEIKNYSTELASKNEELNKLPHSKCKKSSIKYLYNICAICLDKLYKIR